MPKITPIDKSYFVKQYEKLAQAEQEGTFKQTLNGLMDRFNEIQGNAVDHGKAVVTGAQVDSHDVTIAAQEASLAFELMLEVRNKLIGAYQEIMRMQF